MTSSNQILTILKNRKNYEIEVTELMEELDIDIYSDINVLQQKLKKLRKSLVKMEGGKVKLNPSIAELPIDTLLEIANNQTDMIETIEKYKNVLSILGIILLSFSVGFMISWFFSSVTVELYCDNILELIQ